MINPITVITILCCFSHTLVNSIFVLKSIAHIPLDILTTLGNTFSVITSNCHTARDITTYSLIPSHTLYLVVVQIGLFMEHAFNKFIQQAKASSDSNRINLVPAKFTVISFASNLYFDLRLNDNSNDRSASQR